MPESILSRVSHSFSAQPSLLSPLQNQVDGLTASFIDQATDLKSLAALTLGGAAYRLGKMGAFSAKGLAPLSIGLGLGAEVSAFELTHRGLSLENSNRWKWSGPAGLKQGLLSSLVTFSTLKGFGRLSQGQNIVLQHGAQDTAMVLGHQLAYRAGIGPKPEGTLAEQFLHAEAVNWQIKGGMGLAHGALPRLGAMERSLDLSFRTREPVLPSNEDPSIPFLSPVAFGTLGRATRSSYSAEEGAKKLDHLSLSSKEDGREGGRKGRSRPPWDPNPEIQKIRETLLDTGEKAKKRLQALKKHQDLLLVEMKRDPDVREGAKVLRRLFSDPNGEIAMTAMGAFADLVLCGQSVGEKEIQEALRALEIAQAAQGIAQKVKDKAAETAFYLEQAMDFTTLTRETKSSPSTDASVAVPLVVSSSKKKDSVTNMMPSTLAAKLRATFTDPQAHPEARAHTHLLYLDSLKRVSMKSILRPEIAGLKNHLLSIYLAISKRGGTYPINAFPTYQMALQAYTLLLSRLPQGHAERQQGKEMFKLWEGLGIPEINGYIDPLRAWLREKSSQTGSDAAATAKRRSLPSPSVAVAPPDDWYWDSDRKTIFYVRTREAAENCLKDEANPFDFYNILPAFHGLQEGNEKIRFLLDRLRTPQEEKGDHVVISTFIDLDISTAERLGIVEQRGDRFAVGSLPKRWVIAITKKGR